MGVGKQAIIEGGQKGKDNEAEVSDQALHVKVIGGGGSGPTSDVNIASVGGNPVTTTVPVSGTVSVTEPVSVDDNGGSLTVDGTVTVDSITNPVTLVEPVSVDDNGGSLTVDGTVAVSSVGGTVTIAEPVSVDDNGGSLTVDSGSNVGSPAGATDGVFPAGAVRDDALTTLADPDGDYVNLRVTSLGALWTGIIGASGNAVIVSPSGALNVGTTTEENAAVAGGHNVFPAGVVRDDALATLGVADNDWTDLRVTSRGALWVNHDGATTDAPVRSSVTNIINAQLLDDSPTSVNSSTFDVTLYRYLVVYIALTVANAPSNIRLIAQFSNDGGTTWFDYSVDQWVDLRYVPGQMPLNEAIPLNYVTGKLFRLRAVATGTTAAATFTISAWVEGIN